MHDLGAQLHVLSRLMNYGQLYKVYVPHLWKERVHAFPTVHIEDGQPEFSPGWYTHGTSCKNNHKSRDAYRITLVFNDNVLQVGLHELKPDHCCVSCSLLAPYLGHQAQLPGFSVWYN